MRWFGRYLEDFLSGRRETVFPGISRRFTFIVKACLVWLVIASILYPNWVDGLNEILKH